MRFRYHRYTIAQGAEKLKTRIAVAISVAGLAVASGGGLSFALFSAAHADTATGTVVVTPTNTQGWATQNGAPAYVLGPTGADGNGSLKFETDSTSSSKENYFHATNTPLSEVTGLGYRVDVTAGVPASYQLQVTGVDRLDSTTSTFTSLVWEPVYNGQPNGPNGGFVTESNIESGTWWSTHPIAGDTQGNNGFVPLSQIIAANPNATVVAYGVNVGSGTPNATSYVDDVSFNGTTYNFEPVVASGEITSPTADGHVSGTLNLAATYEDGDVPNNDDGVQWAVRQGTCTAGTNTVFGNVDGHSDAYSWDGNNFSASLDVRNVTPGEYCFVFNPVDDSGQPNVRETQTFYVDQYYVQTKDDCKGGGWASLHASDGSTFKNQGLCVSWVEHNVLGHGTPAANRP